MTPATETNRTRTPAFRRPSERARSTLAQLAVKHVPLSNARQDLLLGGTPGHFERDRKPQMHVIFDAGLISIHCQLEKYAALISIKQLL